MRGQVLTVPRQRRGHDLAESRLGIDFVVAIAFEDHQALRLLGMGVKLFRLLRWHEPVVIGGDEENRPGRDLVDDPFGVEPERLVDIF
jgi:hypothetical protein